MSYTVISEINERNKPGCNLMLFNIIWLYCQVLLMPGAGGVIPKKLGRGVQPTSQNPYPIYG